MKKLLIATFALSIISCANAFAHVDAHARVERRTVVVDHYNWFFSEAKIDIKNDSNTPKAYEIDFQFCIEHSECVNESYNIKLNPGEEHHNKFIKKMNKVFNYPGMFEQDVNLEIKGDEKAKSYDMNWINVRQW